MASKEEKENSKTAITFSVEIKWPVKVTPELRYRPCCGAALAEVARNLGGLLGKTIHGEVSHKRHSTTNHLRGIPKVSSCCLHRKSQVLKEPCALQESDTGEAAQNTEKLDRIRSPLFFAIILILFYLFYFRGETNQQFIKRKIR